MIFVCIWYDYDSADVVLIDHPDAEEVETALRFIGSCEIVARAGDVLVYPDSRGKPREVKTLPRVIGENLFATYGCNPPVKQVLFDVLPIGLLRAAVETVKEGTAQAALAAREKADTMKAILTEGGGL